jgi:uncharacterized membrane protein YbhN (UPF0104 family)
MRRVAPFALRVARICGVALLAVLVWQVADGAAALALLGTADPRWLAAAALGLTVQTVLSAQRWRVTAAQLGLVLPPLSALREYYLAQVVNQSVPGGVVGDAGRAVRSRAGAGLLVAAQAVLFERIAGQLGLIAVLVAGLVAGRAVPGQLEWPVWFAATVTAGSAAAALGLALAGLVPAVRRFARAFVQAVWARNVRVSQTVLSLGTALCNVAAFAFCARALDVAMPLVAVASLVPLILFAMVLPLSIGGWGLREGAAAALFPVMGATSAQGLATSVSFGLVFLAITLPGVILPVGLRLFSKNRGGSAQGETQ